MAKQTVYILLSWYEENKRSSCRVRNIYSSKEAAEIARTRCYPNTGGYSYSIIKKKIEGTQVLDNRRTGLDGKFVRIFS